MSWKITTGGSPSAIAGIAPTLDYRFALDRRELDAVTLTDKLTVTRAATAAVNGPTGYLELAGANIARFDHDPTTGESLGLLVEEVRTNYIDYSEDIGSWPTPSTATSNITASPAKNTAYGLNTSSSATVTVPGSSAVTFSGYFKQGSSRYIYVRTVNWSVVQRIYFDLQLGVFSRAEVPAAVSNVFTVSVGDGWYRCGFTIDTIADSSGLFQITATDTNLNINAVGHVYAWGIQVEEGSFVTSYIQTATNAVTRTESATIDGTGVITGTYTMVEKPAGCAVVNGTNIDLQPGYTAERLMVFPAALSSEQITAIRNVM